MVGEYLAQSLCYLWLVISEYEFLFISRSFSITLHPYYYNGSSFVSVSHKGAPGPFRKYREEETEMENNHCALT